MIRRPLRVGAAGLTGFVVGVVGVSWAPLLGVVFGGLWQGLGPGRLSETPIVDGVVDGSAAMLGRQLMQSAVAVRPATRSYALGYTPIPKRAF